MPSKRGLKFGMVLVACRSWRVARAMRSARRATILLLALALLALEVAGCGWKLTREEQARPGLDGEPAWLEVVPKSNREVADLSADDIVRVMQRVGFTDEQILELGTDVHRALLLSGAAALVNGKRTEAVFAVRGEYLYIQSNSRGRFVYSLAKGRFGPAPVEYNEGR